MSIRPEAFTKFKAKFESIVKSSILPEQLQPELEIDAELPLEEITPRFFKVQKRLGPFGPGNPRPVYIAHKLQVTGTVQTPGKKNEHLKFKVSPSTSGTPCIDAIAFNMGHRLTEVNSGKLLSLAFSLDLNEFRGTQTLQLTVKWLGYSESQT